MVIDNGFTEFRNVEKFREWLLEYAELRGNDIDDVLDAYLDEMESKFATNASPHYELGAWETRLKCAICYDYDVEFVYYLDGQVVDASTITDFDAWEEFDEIKTIITF